MNDSREIERERVQASMWTVDSCFLSFFSLQTMCQELMKFKVVSGFCLHQNGLDVDECLKEEFVIRQTRPPARNIIADPGQRSRINRQMHLLLSPSLAWKLIKTDEDADGRRSGHETAERGVRAAFCDASLRMPSHNALLSDLTLHRVGESSRVTLLGIHSLLLHSNVSWNEPICPVFSFLSLFPTGH